MKPVIAVLTENDTDRTHLCSTLRTLFSSYLEVVPLTLSTARTLPLPPKAVLVNMISLPYAERLFPESHILYATRFLNGNNLDRLMSLPGGKEVLVVNKPRQVAEEMVSNLLTLGINHLKLIPYWPGCDMDTSSFDTAVYAGFRYYCPDHMKNYIDLGFRSLMPSVLTKIIKIYDLPSDFMDQIHIQSVKLVVDGLFRLRNSFAKATYDRKSFEQAFLLSANALVTINDSGTVTAFNNTASSLFGIPYTEAIGRPYREIFASHRQLLSLLESGRPVSEQTVRMKNQAFLVTLNRVDIQAKTHIFLSILPAKTILRTSEQTREALGDMGFHARYTFQDIKGTSPAIRRAAKVASVFAKSDSTILITGESGTGKELFAQSIHNASRRAGKPFVGVNFAALPETLIESELFGYEEGAFTGASKGGRLGLFRIAHTGTIFLDEIGDISPAVQNRLLRVLEEREIMPVGSTRVIPVDVRIICATNKDLPQMVAEGRFREDLYFRLKTLRLILPPLRERPEDIPELLSSMLGGRTLPEALTRRLKAYPWPGNIRELKSFAENAELFGELPYDDPDEQEIWDSVADAFFADASCSLLDESPALSADDLLILKCIQEASDAGQSIGRSSLARLPLLKSRGLTEAKLKNHLKKLENAGYTKTGRTRQGISLTPLGQERAREETGG